MKRTITAVLCLSLISIGLIGCGEKSSTKTETKVTTPTGSKTVTTETDVKKTGDEVQPKKTP